MARNLLQKKKILLIHAPFGPLAFGKDWQETPSLAPPLGLMYLAYPLILAGLVVKFVDFNVDRLSLRAFVRLIKNQSYVGISVYTESLSQVKKIIKIIRRANKKIIILCGGPYCNLSKNYIPGADLIAIGEAEQYMADILERLEAHKSLRSIPGLIYKQNGRLLKTGGVMQVENLDLSQHASLLLGKGKDYGHFFGLKLPNLIGMMTSRGCPFDCRYCTHRVIAKYRERSIGNVIDEIKTLAGQGYKYIAFYDDNFLVNRNRATEIMDRIIAEKIKIRIIVQGRVDSVDEGFYRKLRQAGVMMIMFGIESANQEILDYYRKRVKIETIKKAVRMANKAGILTFGYFIIGAPADTYANFKQDLELINSSGLDFAIIHILGYYQGSELWEDAVAKKLIGPRETIVWANKKLSNFSYQQLFNIKNEMTKGVYLSPKRWLRILWKMWKMGEAGLLIYSLIKLNKDLLAIARNPFIPQTKEKKNIVVS